MNAFSVIPPCRHRNLDLTLLSLSLQKERGWQPHPVALRRPSPSQGEGCFGESQNRVRSHGLSSTFLSFRAFSFVIPSALFCHSEHFFFVIPNASEESTAWMLRCAQHDKGGVIPSALFCHSRHFFVIPSIFFCHSKCSFLSFRARARNPQTILCSNLPNQD